MEHLERKNDHWGNFRDTNGGLLLHSNGSVKTISHDSSIVCCKVVYLT